MVTFYVLDIETNTAYQEQKTNEGTKMIPCASWLYLGCIMRSDLQKKFFHSWQECLDILKRIPKKSFIFVHNLAYETEFMTRNGIQISDIIANTEHEPIQFKDQFGHVFRCSLKLLDKSLSKVGKDVGLPKLDYEYEGIRTLGNLTDKDYEYNARDCEIVVRAIFNELKVYKTLKNIPLTKTGRVRRKLKESEGAETIRSRAHRAFPSLALYDLLEKSFVGGLTYGNPESFGKWLINVKSADRKSAYPAEMLTQRFPHKFSEVFEGSDANIRFESIKCNSKIHFVGEFILYDVTAIDRRICILPASKCMLGSLITTTFNGKVSYAEKIRICADSVSLRNYFRIYRIGSIECVKLSIVTSMRRLPIPIIKLIAQLMVEKNRLGLEMKTSNDPDISLEYMRIKEMINSLYGANVQKFRDFVYSVDDNGIWSIECMPYKEPKNLMRVYAWGVWITAYNRYHLTDKILEVGADDFVYSDTDSVKAIDVDPSDTDLFIKGSAKEYLQSILTPEEFQAIKKLGTFMSEDGYDEFMQIGAKKYFYIQNGEFGYTVAGLPKPTPKLLDEGANFPTCKVDVYVGASFDKVKLAHRFVNNELDEGPVFMYTKGNYIEIPKEVIKDKGGVALFSVSYRLNITEIDEQYARDYGCEWKHANIKERFTTPLSKIIYAIRNSI